MTDRELIRKLHTGDRSALDGIVEKYYDDIYKFCLYMTMDETDSYDIVQEVFLRFIKYADAYTHGNLKGYLLIIARNLCRDYFRKKEKEKTVDLTADVVSERDGIEDTEQKLLLDTILQKLPIEQRETVILRFREELRFQDIARILGCMMAKTRRRRSALTAGAGVLSAVLVLAAAVWCMALAAGTAVLAVQIRRFFNEIGRGEILCRE